MRPIVLGLSALVACTPAPSRPALVANEGEPSSVDRDFASRYSLDYRHPMLAYWDHDAIPHKDYRELCSAGDRVACLQSTMARRTAGGVISDIMLNCRAGDDLSCRYDEWARADFKLPYPFTLSRTELRRGCAAGIAPECDLLLEAKGVDDVRFGAETSCLRAKRECVRAAESYLREEPRSKQRAQYYLEVDCQSYGAESCLRLVDAYRGGELEEPVLGRADKLEAFVCARHEELCADRRTRTQR